MQNQTVQMAKGRENLAYLLLLTGFLILLEISFFIQCNQAYLSGFAEVSQQLHIPITILPGVLFFIAIQLAIHFVFCFLAWLISLGLIHLFSIKKQFTVAIFIWGVLLSAGLLANQIYYPNSKFSELTEFIFCWPIVTKILLWVLFALLSTTVVLALLGFIRAYPKEIFITFCVSLPVFCLIYLKFIFLPFKLIYNDKPNVIIIGIDSLRPDFLSFFGGETSTAVFDKFLNEAVVFTDAVTPLARTFPSWVTILTGKYPREIGVRSNLAPQANLNLTYTLPAVLKHNGYKTIFATDETRFSNIDTNFGFDNIVSPPMGLNDFLIGSLNDFPLSNLIVNTPIGRWLFPHSYANRGVFFTYKPSSFLNVLTETLDRHAVAKKQPLFLSVHFCLPHFPYIWDRYKSAKFNVLDRYQASIKAVENQFSEFLQILKRYGVLDYAVVVVLSDHGEALELPGDRITDLGLYTGRGAPQKFYPPTLNDEEDFNQSAGHGTDVLGLTQYHSLLAFKLYTSDRAKPGHVSGSVSLAQVMPTLLEILNINSPVKLPISLARYIKFAQGRVKNQAIFLETDFAPSSIRTVYPEVHKVMLEGIQLFEVMPSTTRLILKKDMEKMIIASKQYAVIYGDWLLAVYPQRKAQYVSILINLKTGLWTDSLKSHFAQTAPAYKLLTFLCNFYGEELHYPLQEYSHSNNICSQELPKREKLS